MDACLMRRGRSVPCHACAAARFGRPSAFQALCPRSIISQRATLRRIGRRWLCRCESDIPSMIVPGLRPSRPLEAPYYASSFSPKSAIYARVTACMRSRLVLCTVRLLSCCGEHGGWSMDASGLSVRSYRSTVLSLDRNLMISHIHAACSARTSTVKTPPSGENTADEMSTNDR